MKTSGPIASLAALLIGILPMVGIAWGGECFKVGVGEPVFASDCEWGPVIAEVEVQSGETLEVPFAALRWNATLGRTVLRVDTLKRSASGSTPIVAYRSRTLDGVVFQSRDLGVPGGLSSLFIGHSYHLIEIPDEAFWIEYLGVTGAVVGRQKVALPTTDCQECTTAQCHGSTKLGSIDFQIPIGTIPGEGSLEAQSVGLQYFQESVVNAGRESLMVRAGSNQAGVTIVENELGYLESVQVGPVLTRIDHLGREENDPIPASPDLLRFRVRVSSDADDPDNTIFRSVTIETTQDAMGNDQLVVTETIHGLTKATVYRNPAPGAWVMETGNGMRRETRVESETATERIERITVEELIPGTPAVYEAVSDLQRTFTRFDWGWEETASTEDPDGAALTTTSSYYVAGEDSSPDGSGAALGEARLKQRVHPTGEIERHFYFDYPPEEFFDSGHLVRRAFAGTQDGLEVTTSQTSGTSPSSGMPITIEQVEKVANGFTIAKTETLREELVDGVLIERRVYHEDGSFYPTFTIEGADQSVVTVNPDGTATSSIRSSDLASETTTTTNAMGIVLNDPASGTPVIDLVTEEFTVINKGGEVLERTEKRHPSFGSPVLVSQKLATTFDSAGRVTAYAKFSDTAPGNVLAVERDYNCCGLARTSDQFGVETLYAYDALGRRTKTHSLGVTTETVYQGRAISAHRYAEAAPGGVLPALSHATPANEIARTVRDLTGRTVEQWRRTGFDGSLVQTTIETTFNPGGGIGRRMVVRPPVADDDGPVVPEQISDYYLDGTLASRTGSLGPDTVVEFGADATGLLSSRSLLEGGVKRQTVTTSFNWARRPVRITYSSDEDGNGQDDFSEFAYNAEGQLVREVDPDGMTSLFDYNERGEQTITAIDLNGNGAIDFDADQVRFSERDLPVSGTEFRTTEKVWQDGVGGDGAVVVAQANQSFDGLQQRVTSYPAIRPNETHGVTNYLSPGNWTQTTVLPDATSEVSTYAAGLLDNTAAYDANSVLLYRVSFTYDAFNRLRTVADTRIPGVVTNHHVSEVVDLIRSVEDPAGRITTFAYDQRDRLVAVDRPDTLDADGNLLSNVTATSYFPDGQPKEVSGGQSYRRTYSYDFAQRLSTLTTYGSTTAVTRWLYDGDRGFLRGKRYDSSTPEAGTGPSYSYTPAGRLKSRTQVRQHEGNPLVSSYIYGTAVKSHAGLLDEVQHSDGTPGYVILSRDRLGRPLTIDDQAAGARTIRYWNYGVARDEQITGSGVLSGTSLTYLYDSRLRPAWAIQTAESHFSRATRYQYDDAGRLFSVHVDGHTAEYRYDPGHQQISQLSIRPYDDNPDAPVDGPPILQHTRHYDELRRLVGTTWHSASTGAGPKPLAHHGFEYNDLDQRTRRTDPGGRQWEYGYNASGELARADKKDAAGTNFYPGLQFRYQFDGVGNRTALESGGDLLGSNRRTHASTFEVLNQTVSRTHSGVIDLLGQAPAADEVTVNGNLATRLGSFFHGEVAVDNSGGPVWGGISISDGSTSVAGSSFIPAATFAPGYDEDGNSRGDGQWDYSWDAQNRLAEVERSALAVAAGAPYRRFEYTYDYLGRRIRSETFDAPAAPAPVSSTLYLHDGSNCTAELDGDRQPVRFYTRGLDLSGSLQGGGGVGGLLWITDRASGDLHLCTYDGNGNLANLVAENGSSLTATYQYDPFGNLLRATGPYAAQNPVRFATKFHNSETGLSYYGLRFYDPAQARWLNRDPIEEAGGLNLYGFVGNDPIGNYDALGANPVQFLYDRSEELLWAAGRVGSGVDDHVTAFAWAGERIETAVTTTASDYAVERQIYGADYANYNLTVGAYLHFNEGLAAGSTGAGYILAWATGNEDIPEFLDHNMEGLRWALDQIARDLCADPDSAAFKIGAGGGKVVGTIVVPAGEFLVIKTAAAGAKGALMVVRAPANPTKVINGVSYELRASKGGAGPNRWHRVSGASSGSNATRQGVSRNNPADWRATRDLWDELGYSDILSDANRVLINRGLVPEVDNAWIRTFPGDASFRNELIPIHHIQGLPLNIPTPATRHLEAHMPGGFRYNPGSVPGSG